MASITPAVTEIAPGVMRIFWETLTESDTVVLADALDEKRGGPSRPDKCVQITGSFGSGNVSIEGSNDGTNFEVLNDVQGNALTLSAAGLKQIAENPRYIRPGTPTGTSVDVDVTLIYAGNYSR